MRMKLMLVALVAAVCSPSANACFTYVVGKGISSTGRVIVGHNEDDPAPYAIRHGVLPAADWPAGTMLPASTGHAAVPQAAHTLSTYWSEVKFAYGDGNADSFYNEKGVFIVSNCGGFTRDGEMSDATALTDGGLRFNLRRAVGERATSARDAVRIMGELLTKYGYAQPARIYTVADKDEAWMVQVVHGRNYVAVRCPDDAVSIMPNLYTVYELEDWDPKDIVVSPDLVANARRKGYWDGTGRFNFAKAYQGSYAYGPERAFEHPNNTGRFRQAIRDLTGEDWPVGKPFPFAVRPKAAKLSAADVQRFLSSHNGYEPNGRHVLETWSVCCANTVESSVCAFADDPRDTVLHVAPGRGCETVYQTFRPFREPLPIDLDDTQSAVRRLADHVHRVPDVLVTDHFTVSTAARGCTIAQSRPEGSPFTYFTVTPKADRATDALGTLEMLPITLSATGLADSWRLVTLGTAGLRQIQPGVTIGSHMFFAVAEPGTRRGVVCGWLTSEKGAGLLKARTVEGRVSVQPSLQYGNCRAKAGEALPAETFVVGFFDDCRKGLEAYADAVARLHGIRLKPQIAGYCTWYAEQPYGWGGDEGSTREFAALVNRLGLKKWGFEFFQIDDFWQDGELTNGPGKNFTRVRAKGPYPSGMRATFDNLAANGIVPGIWFMPFSGTANGDWWRDKQDLFVRTADGRPYETRWGGTVLDMTNPKAVGYLKDVTRRICGEWHCRYIKYDGMWTALGCELGAGGRDGLEPDDYGRQRFFDPAKTGVEAYRAGVKALREAAGPDTFILACNLAQTVRGMGPSYGLVDAMRVGGDNGPWERRWMIGVEPATTRYFFNGRVWYNDPDPVYVRDARALGKARLMASWTSLAGFFFNFSDWIGNLSEERLELLKRTLAPHRSLNARPVELFEKALPNVWQLAERGYAVYALCNFNTADELSVDYAPDYAGLDPAKSYAAFDFWNGRFLAPVRGRFAFKVPRCDCRIVALREFDGTKPVLVSTSRHVASPVFDVTDEAWDAQRLVLSGVSKVVPGERYELRVSVPEGLSCVSADGGEVRQSGGELRVAFVPAGERLSWRLAFRKD